MSRIVTGTWREQIANALWCLRWMPAWGWQRLVFTRWLRRMRKLFCRGLLLGPAVWLFCLTGPAMAYLTDSNVYAPPDYFTWLPPDAGGRYTGPVFGTTIKRLSRALSTPDAAFGSGNLTFIMNEYSTMSPFNADNSRLLLLHGSYFALYDGSGNYVRDLPFEINSMSEPRWSRRDPNVLYYVRGNELKQYNAATGVSSVVHTFSEYTTVYGAGESDICFDGDHFVFVGDSRDVFVYEISTDTKGPVLDTSGLGGFDSLYITPDDHVLIGWYAPGSGRYQGIELYDRNMNFLRQVAPAIGHMDVTRDVDGSEVLLWINAGDLHPPADCQNALVKIRLSDGYRTCLITFDWSLAQHVSAPDGNGWFFVSTYSSADLSPLRWWPKYANEILQIKLDGSEVRRLAHHRSRPFDGYNYTPRAAVSRDGSRLVYSSNYGLQALLSYPNGYTDAYLVGLRFEENEVPVWQSCDWFPNRLALHGGGGAVLAMVPGAQAIFPFTGIGVRWIGYRDEWSGIAYVYLDGQLQATVDTFASPAQAQTVLFSASGLTLGPHLLVVEVTGARNERSRGSWVWVDAFGVGSGDSGSVRVEEDSPAIFYSHCPWFANTLALHSGGRAILAMEPGAQVGFTFTGTAASWIGYRDQWSGIARVYVDGVFRDEVDTYTSPYYDAQRVMYTVSDLPPGRHTLIVEVTGSKNPASGGIWIWVDAFEIPP